MDELAADGALANAKKLGLLLRTLRKKRGLTAAQAGAEVGCHASQISRYETATRVVGVAHFERLMEVYRVTDVQRDELEALADQARDAEKPWWSDYGDAINTRYARLLDAESTATSCFDYQTVLVTGLLQTEGYTRAVTAVGFGEVGPSQVDALVEVRMRRQKRVFTHERPLELSVVLTEAALCFRVGGAKVHRAQLVRLIEAPKKFPNVTVRIIPFDAGEDGTQTGAFNIYRCPPEPDVGFSESVSGGSVFKSGLDLRRMNRLSKTLTRVSLEPGASADLIRKYL
ncbi:helix-turn-helix domain-containing protein [Embleya sp. NPDC001921]